jgi:hypothetical protein
LSFSDRIGEFAKDLGGAALAAPKFVWDVSTAPWNDAEEFNGFKNTFVSAGANAFSSVIKPLADIAEVPGIKQGLEKWDAFNREYIREPLTTTALMAAEGLNPLDGSDWKKAYDQAQTTSFGQATVGAIGAITPGEQSVEKEVDWTNPKSVDDYFNHGPQKLWSGIGDVGIQFFGDVAIGVGKAGKAARASDYVTNSLLRSNSAAKRAEAIQGVTDAINGIENKYSPMLQDFVDNDFLYAYNHPMLKNSPSRDVLASALGQATSKVDAGLVVKAGLGDSKALDTIREIGRSDLANPIAKAQGELDATDKFLLKGELGEDGIPKHIFEDTDVFKEADTEIESLIANNENFLNFWKTQNVDEIGFSINRTVGATPFQAVDRFVAQGRAAKFYDRVATDVPDVKIFQPTPFHRMYQVFSWAAGERPSGWVNLNEAESSREVTAIIEQAIKHGGVAKESGRKMLQSYVAAATPEARAAVIEDLELFTVMRLAEKHSIDVDQAEQIYRTYRGKRATAMSTIKEKGYILDADNTAKKVELLESETVDSLPVMDFALADNIFKLHNLKSKDNWLGKQALGFVLEGGERTVSILDTMQSLFKVGALLRLGYTIRNSAEAQLRISASVGSIAAMRHFGKGVDNLIYNSKNTVTRSIDRLNPYTKSYGFYKGQYDNLGTEITDLQKQIDSLQNKIDRVRDGIDPEDFNIVDNPDDIASMQKFQDLLDGKKSLRDKTDIAMASFETKKRHMGTGTFKYKDVDGNVYELPDAFNTSTFGDIHWRNSSSENSYISLADSDARLLSRDMVHTGWGEITPDAPNYWDEWAKAINRKFGNSEVARRIAAGENPYTVVSWLHSREGAQLRQRLGLDTSDVREYVESVNKLFNQYAPDQELRDMMLRRETISPDLLRSKFNDPTQLPTINGSVIEENLDRIGVKKFQEIAQGMFKFLGSMPEDAWARHPVYIDLYRKSLKRRIDDFNYLNEGKMTLPQGADAILSKDIQSAMKGAHAEALAGTKQILFTIDRKTNLSSLFKFVSPFFSAYENSIKTWAKLAYDKPQLINRANLIFTAPNRAGIATDANGNPVPVEEATMNDYIWIEVPEGMKKLPFIGKGLEVLTNVGIQKRSLDVVFQGDVKIPVGPYVSIPVSEIVKSQPSYEQSLKWAIPFGAERSAVMAMLPSWVKKQLTKTAGQSDPQYANTYTLIWQTEQHKRKEQGLAAATPDEIKAMADAYWNMRTVANLILPFAPQFNSPYKMYIDKWRQYRETYGKDAPAKFWEEYGDDMFKFTMSLSKNNTGSAATAQDVENAKRYGDLVSQISEIDPKMIGLVTSTGNGAYQFSDAAYKWQMQTPLSSATEVTFRGRNDPAQAVKENNAQLGWIKYREMMNYVDTELQARGITSINDKRAADLAQMKKTTVSFLANQNEDWYIDYKDIDGSKYLKVRDTFDKILNNKKFMADHGNDPTWKSVRLYLNIQSDIESMLAERKAAGLPATITAKANADLAQILETAVNKLKQEDIGFGDLYDRYLSYDPVFDPNISKVGQ